MLLLHQVICCDCKYPSQTALNFSELSPISELCLLIYVLMYNLVGQPLTIHHNCQQPLTKVRKCSKIQFSSTPRCRAGLMQSGNYVSDFVLFKISAISAHLSSCELRPCELPIWFPQRPPCSVIIGECLRVANEGTLPGQSCWISLWTSSTSCDCWFSFGLRDFLYHF